MGVRDALERGGKRWHKRDREVTDEKLKSQMKSEGQRECMACKTWLTFKV